MPEKEEIGQFHFHYVDYIVFALMLILSTGTGVYYGYYKRREVSVQQQSSSGVLKVKKFRTMSEYLLGSRNLSTFPVAMSLVASYISGVTILGTPSEIYNYGTQYYLIIVSIIFMGVAVAKLYLPVFSALRVDSSYEYLEKRFNSHIRSLASFMFIMDEVFFLPIILYVPAIAFKQVTGVNIHIISSIVCVICVLYTLVGGIKAVVHTDAWQVLVMFVSVIVVVILGTIEVGGPAEAFKYASEGGRLIMFDLDPSPFKRHTFWGVLIGGFLYWTSFNSVNQTMVQRYMSLPTLRNGQISIIYFVVGIVLFLSFCVFAGLLIYSFYRHCDPLTAGLIQNDDQLFPVYVMQTIGHLRGVPGLFIAGVFGAALSSLSVVLNSTALVLLEDIVKGCFKIKMTTRASSILVKTSVVVLGCIALSLVIVIEKMGAILSVATSMTAIAAGTSFGLFTLGMMVPWSNNKGAAAGAVAGILMSGWISFGTQFALAAKRVVPQKLEMSVSECPFNVTATPNVYPDDSDVFPLYRLSFHWINPIGVGSVLLVGTIVSFLTGPTKLKDLDANHISPVLHRYLPKECFEARHVDLSRGTTATRLLEDGSSASDGRGSQNTKAPEKY